MSELPETLKKYLPAPLSVVVEFGRWVGSDRIKDFAWDQFTPPPAHIWVEHLKNNLLILYVEVARYSEKLFEEIGIEVQLRKLLVGIEIPITQFVGAFTKKSKYTSSLLAKLVDSPRLRLLGSGNFR